MNETILSFEKAELGYHRDVILSEVNCHINKGSFTGIVGPNGSGKTTFLRASLGLIAPLKGNITRNKNQHFAYVSQLEHTSQLWPLTIQEVVELGVRSRRLWGRLSSDEEKAVKEACEKTSLDSISHKLFTDCSGGQKQRARLAQALAQQPDVLVLDEPTTGLDVNIERDFLLLVKSLQKKENLTILFVTHTIHIPLYFADQTFIIREGQLTALTNKELQDPYTLEKYYGAPLNYEKLAQTPHHD